MEERCNDDKEERMEIGRHDGGQIRMLGSYMDRKKDLDERLRRMRRSWFVVKKRLKGSRISKKMQGKVIELCVESTALFDSSMRPWHASEIRKIQQNVDRSYRYIWAERNAGEPLRQMERQGKNM